MYLCSMLLAQEANDLYLFSFGGKTTSCAPSECRQLNDIHRIWLMWRFNALGCNDKASAVDSEMSAKPLRLVD